MLYTFCTFAISIKMTILMKYFLLDKKQSIGTLFFRIVKRNPEMNMRVSTGIKVEVSVWEKAQASVSAWDRYCHTEKGKVVAKKLTLIDEAIANLFAEGRISSNADKPLVEFVVNIAVNGDAIKQEAEIKAIKEAEAKKKQQQEMEQSRSIVRFYDAFLGSIESGERKYGNNESYRKASVVSWRSFGKHLRGFCKERDTFDIIDKRFADRFSLYLEKKGLLPMTINKYIVCFRKLCNVSAEDGINKNATSLRVWKEKKVDTESKRTEIYLTDEEIDALYDYPFEGRDAEVRDVFLIGCISCQRYSDYGSLSEKNFGFTMNGTPVIKVKQQKTNHYVEIPIMDERVIDLCRKYDYDFPRISSRRINDYLQAIAKKVAEVCPSLNEKYPTILTQQEQSKERHFAELSEKVAKGIHLNKEDARTYRILKEYADEHNGQPLYERNVKGEIIKCKWELVTSHTARRSGITNHYKGGFLNSREIMSMSGHTSERIFEEYIKVGTSEMADRIADKIAKTKKLNIKGKAI